MLRPARTFALVLLAAAACRGDRPEAPTTPVRGGTAVVGILGDFQAFNAVVNTSSVTDEVMKHLLFVPLVQYDARLRVVPALAERWELSDTAVTFHLRRDLRWHDGRPVTAEDVVFTFDLAKNPATASLLGSAYLSLVARAEALDSFTVRFRFVAPHAQALEDFWWPPMPKHLLEGATPATLAQHPFNRRPVGNGPFRFVAWEPGQRLVLEANPMFPAALGGRPNLDRVVFRVIPEPMTLLTTLFNGETDVVGYTLLPEQGRQIAQQPRFELKHFPGREFAYVGWNHAREPFRDARVRRALAMAIDRPGLVRGLLYGYGRVADGPIPPWSPLYTPIRGLPYDPAHARALLDSAGWRDTDGDGIREKNGRPMRFTLLTNTENRLRQDVATRIQQQLRAVGARVDVRTLEFQTMLRLHKARDYDAIVSGWVLDNFKIDPTPLFACAEARKPGSANRAGYCNPRADSLLARGLRATDPDEARRIWAAYTAVLVQDQPVTFLYWPDDMGGVGPRLHNVVMDVRSKLVNAARWWKR